MTFNEADKILQQLPVSYYLGRKLAARLDDTTNYSYFNLMNDELVVSYNQLNKIENPQEEEIRCMLYHEVSHALLTPTWLEVTDQINIFEDERIETICKDKYINVNFKDFCKRLNNFKETEPKSELESFYQIVRFRFGKKEFTDRVQAIILKHKYLMRSSLYNLEYVKDITDLWNDISEDFKRNHLSLPEEKHDFGKDDCDMTDLTKEFELDESEVSELDESEDLKKIDIEDSEELEELDCMFDKAVECLNKEIESMTDVNLQKIFTEILSKKKQSSKMNSSAINAYSGVFNLRSVSREDCKYFIKQNRLGNVKAFSKLKLNLFIDVSGSFRKSQDVVNNFLYNLRKVEKQISDFSFDVVTINTDIKILDKTDRKIVCSGGNDISRKIFDIYGKLQDRSSENVNIIMFDGDAYSDYRYDSEYRKGDSSKVFNHDNCIIISDYDNKEYFDRTCKNAKTIYTYSYAKALMSNVIKMLQAKLR